MPSRRSEVTLTMVRQPACVCSRLAWVSSGSPKSVFASTVINLTPLTPVRRIHPPSGRTPKAPGSRLHQVDLTMSLVKSVDVTREIVSVTGENSPVTLTKTHISCKRSSNVHPTETINRKVQGTTESGRRVFGQSPASRARSGASPLSTPTNRSRTGPCGTGRF